MRKWWISLFFAPLAAWATVPCESPLTFHDFDSTLFGRNGGTDLNAAGEDLQNFLMDIVRKQSPEALDAAKPFYRPLISDIVDYLFSSVQPEKTPLLAAFLKAYKAYKRDHEYVVPLLEIVLFDLKARERDSIDYDPEVLEALARADVSGWRKNRHRLLILPDEIRPRERVVGHQEAIEAFIAMVKKQAQGDADRSFFSRFGVVIQSPGFGPPTAPPQKTP